MVQAKKQISVLLLLTFLFSFVVAPMVSMVSVQAAPQTSKWVTANGFLTNEEKGTRICGFNELEEPEEIEETEAESGGLIGTMISNAIFWVFDVIIEFLVIQAQNIMKCETEEVDENGNVVEGSTGIGLFQQVNVFTELVNITHISSLMYLTGIIQKIALVLMVLFILIHGYNLLTGSNAVSETGSTVSFFIKFGVVMFAVYQAPFLMQDVLNLNNKLTYVLSNQVIPMASAFDGPTTSTLNLTIGNSFIASFIIFLQSAVSSATAGGAVLGAIIALIVIIAVFTPMIKIVLWWYTRMFKIFVLTVISPLMLATLATPSLSSTGFGFIKNYIKTALEQFFVIIGLAVVAVFMSEVPLLVKELGLGYVGMGLSLFAGYSFISQVPEMATSMLEGRADGSINASALGGALGAVASGGKRAGQSVARNTRGMFKDEKGQRMKENNKLNRRQARDSMLYGQQTAKRERRFNERNLNAAGKSGKDSSPDVKEATLIRNPGQNNMDIIDADFTEVIPHKHPKQISGSSKPLGLPPPKEELKT